MPLLIFMIGTCFGSFISCMSHRYITHTSILGRSHCDYCGHTLHLLDLVPVLSYILLKGQCRYCHHKLNKNLLIHEVTAGFLFVLFYLHDGLNILYLSHICILTCFYIISIIDEYSANGRPLVTVEKSTQYAKQVHLTKKLNTVGSPF